MTNILAAHDLEWELCVEILTPIFFGLLYSKRTIVLAAYFTHDDAVSYAHNVCNMTADQFTVRRITR